MGHHDDDDEDDNDDNGGNSCSSLNILEGVLSLGDDESAASRTDAPGASAFVESIEEDHDHDAVSNCAPRQDSIDPNTHTISGTTMTESNLKEEDLASDIAKQKDACSEADANENSTNRVVVPGAVSVPASHANNIAENRFASKKSAKGLRNNKSPTSKQGKKQTSNRDTSTHRGLARSSLDDIHAKLNMFGGGNHPGNDNATSTNSRNSTEQRKKGLGHTRDDLLEKQAMLSGGFKEERGCSPSTDAQPQGNGNSLNDPLHRQESHANRGQGRGQALGAGWQQPPHQQSPQMSASETIALYELGIQNEPDTSAKRNKTTIWSGTDRNVNPGVYGVESNLQEVETNSMTERSGVAPRPFSTMAILEEGRQSIQESDITNTYQQPLAGSPLVMMDSASVDGSSSSSAGDSTSPLIEAFLVRNDSQLHLGSPPPADGDSDGGEQEEIRRPEPQDVPPEDTMEVIVAHQVNLLDLLQNRSIQVFIGLLLCLVVSISVVSSIVIVMSRPDTSTDIKDPEEVSLLETLPEDTQIHIGESLSVQNRSYHWLQDHPDLNSMQKWRKQQLFAMATFFHAFNGNEWPENERAAWLNYSTHECYWGQHDAFEIDCDGEFHLLKLQVNRFIRNFTGTIPPELSMLTFLQDITLKNNILGVDLPSLVPAQLINHSLSSLHLSRNRLSGEISSDSILFSFSKLTSLDLSWNHFGGSLPDLAWSQLSDLQHLDLRQNSFNSSLPESIGQLSGLEHLFLQDTALTGIIQEDMCSTSSKTTIRVDCDRVNCDSASCCECGLREYVLLPNFTLTSLQDDPRSPQSLAYTWLEEYPEIALKQAEEWKLHQMYALATFYYSLNGTGWPPALQGSKSRWLDWSDIECEWGFVDSVKGNSCRDGRFRQLALSKPSELPKDFDETFPLSGTIPQEVALLSSLESIVILESELATPLSQMIPDQVQNLAKLTGLTFKMNSINGTITDRIISSLPISLTTLDLRDNMIAGTIPAMMASLSNLTYLDLSKNQLSGSIPRELGELTLLVELNLAENMFNATIDGASYDNNAIIDNTTNATMGDFMALAVGKAILPLEICRLPKLQRLIVTCGNVACPFGCDYTCSEEL